MALLAPALAINDEEVEADDEIEDASDDGKDGGDANNEIGFPSTLISLFLLCEINLCADELGKPVRPEEELRFIKLTPGMLIGLVVKCCCCCCCCCCCLNCACCF